ncbi:FMR1 neighbor protein [Patagioenas fasciata]|uniref:FMR1 neighbor protein n=1 Tax=Patagioenas fasciata TaxID=372321 RepID=UPI003A99F37F
MPLIGTHPAWNSVVLILLCSVNSSEYCKEKSVFIGAASFAQQTLNVSEKGEVLPSHLQMKLQELFDAVKTFFRPVTCRYRDEQVLIPCNLGEGLNKTECLKNKCCPSKTSHDLTCYMPFNDNIQLIFRVLVLAAGGFLTLGCLPFCCFACLQRSPCVNPLRSANKEIAQTMQKKRAHKDDLTRRLLE